MADGRDEKIGEDNEGTGEGGESRPKPPARGGGRRRPVIKKRTKRKEVVEELQEPDEFMEKGTSVVDWLLDHGKTILVSVAVVFVLIIIWTIVDSSRQAKQAEAAEALHLAQKELPAGRSVGPNLQMDFSSPADAASDAKAVAALDKVIAEYDGTPQAQMARVDAAAIKFKAGDYAAAAAYYEAAADAKGLIGDRVALGKAAALEAQEKYDEALGVLTRLRDRSRGDVKEQALVDMARVHEAKGDFEGARGIYAGFVAEFPDSLRLPQVQARIADLATK